VHFPVKIQDASAPPEPGLDARNGVAVRKTAGRLHRRDGLHSSGPAGPVVKPPGQSLAPARPGIINFKLARGCVVPEPGLRVIMPFPVPLSGLHGRYELNLKGGLVTSTRAGVVLSRFQKSGPVLVPHNLLYPARV